MELEMLGISTPKIKQFNKKGIETIESLVEFIPRKYYDFRHPKDIDKLVDSEITSVVGKITDIRILGPAKNVVNVKIKDSKGTLMTIVWFNQSYVRNLIFMDKEYIFCGKIQNNEAYSQMQMVNPYYFGEDIDSYKKIMPVYSKIQGMSDDFLRKSISSAIALTDKTDYLEPVILSKFKVVNKAAAIKQIHDPESPIQIDEAKKRFIFDDLFKFCFKLTEMQGDITPKAKYPMKKIEKTLEFVKTLPFELTDGQKDVLNKIAIKMKHQNRVNALIQGDVGCGKTIVSIILMLIAAENGYQSAMMAPTNVLAKQHYEDILERTKDFGIKVAYLSGEMKVKERREILKQIKDGEIDIVVGTHAVISQDVVFNNLSFTVVDEEHRFGVAQRDKLREKAREGVHSITMSATPIPRTLAMTIYGDSIDVMTITTMPKGRFPIKTMHCKNEEAVYQSMYKQILEGRQCYVVCPLIEDSESERLENVDSVENTYSKMLKYFKGKNVNIAMISGKMKQSEVNEEIEKFSKNEYQIIISTTIIEVGVNVPNASVIMIKNAERFGLSQLHQLRGRVGRGIHQSYCVLLSEADDNPKLQAMCATTDGFKIAEKDLEIRGAGDFIGTKQSGQNKYIMLMLAYPILYGNIKKEVIEIYKDNRRLMRYKTLDLSNIYKS